MVRASVKEALLLFRKNFSEKFSYCFVYAGRKSELNPLK